jgi:hypothetical protein
MYHLRMKMEALLLLVLMSGLEACVSRLEGTAPAAIKTVTTTRALRMGMTPEQMIQAWSDTRCKIETLFHGNPAQAWGYETREFQSSSIPKASDCDRANYWIYFENDRLVGWTPLR